MSCWICGGEAVSGEHKIKASDLKSEFGDVSQKNPLYISDNKNCMTPVGSIKRTQSLRFSSKICSFCNNSRTQDFDLAWEKLSSYLRKNNKSSRKERINLVKVFPGSINKEMLNVHLYFLKILGCAIVSSGASINMSPLTECIMKTKAHPYLYLTFEFNDELGRAGTSDLDVEMIGDRSSAVVWLYNIGNIAVKILLADPLVKRRGHEKGWHPEQRSKFLNI